MNVRALAVALTIALLAPAAPYAARAADAPAVVIPVITTLTGSGAFIGKESADVLGRLETLLNRQGGIKGKPLHFEIYDDQGKPQVAVQLVNEIQASGHQIILGPSLTNSCLAVAPFIESKVVDYCMSPGVSPPRDSFMFAPNVSGADIFAAMVRFFRKKNWNRIATLTTSDATGQQADQRLGGAVAQPENKGVDVVAQEHFAPTDLTVGAQVARIKAAKPDAVVVWVIGTPFATALRGMSDAAFEAPVFASNSNMIYDQLKEWSSFMPAQLLFSGPQFLGSSAPRAQRAAVNQFYALTRDAGVTPDLVLAITVDPALILISALRQLGVTATAQQVHTYIEGLHDYPGILGIYDFTTGDQRGLTQRDLVILRWDAKRSALVGVSKPGGDPL